MVRILQVNILRSMVNVFTIQRKVCVKEIPNLVEVQNEIKIKCFNIVSVVTDNGENKGVIVFINMTMTYYGYGHGATRVELEKVIRICLECVGIGQNQKSKTFKLDKNLRKLKYIILIVFVIILPLFLVDIFVSLLVQQVCLDFGSYLFSYQPNFSIQAQTRRRKVHQLR